MQELEQKSDTEKKKTQDTWVKCPDDADSIQMLIFKSVLQKNQYVTNVDFE